MCDDVISAFCAWGMGMRNATYNPMPGTTPTSQVYTRLMQNAGFMGDARNKTMNTPAFQGLSVRERVTGWRDSWCYA